MKRSSRRSPQPASCAWASIREARPRWSRMPPEKLAACRTTSGASFASGSACRSSPWCSRTTRSCSTPRRQARSIRLHQRHASSRRSSSTSRPRCSTSNRASGPPDLLHTAAGEVDRAGVRVGVSQGSTSQGVLGRELKQAEVVPVASLKAAGDMLAGRRAPCLRHQQGDPVRDGRRPRGRRRCCRDAGAWSISRSGFPRDATPRSPISEQFVAARAAKASWTGSAARGAARNRVSGTVEIPRCPTSSSPPPPAAPSAAAATRPSPRASCASARACRTRSARARSRIGSTRCARRTSGPSRCWRRSRSAATCPSARPSSAPRAQEPRAAPAAAHRRRRALADGQAKCRQCKEPIEKGSWRIRLVFHEEGVFSPGGFIHLACRQPYFETTDILEQVLHFSPALSAEDRAELEAALRG